MVGGQRGRGAVPAVPPDPRQPGDVPGRAQAPAGAGERILLVEPVFMRRCCCVCSLPGGRPAAPGGGGTHPLSRAPPPGGSLAAPLPSWRITSPTSIQRQPLGPHSSPSAPPLLPNQPHPQVQQSSLEFQSSLGVGSRFDHDSDQGAVSRPPPPPPGNPASVAAGVSCFCRCRASPALAALGAPAPAAPLPSAQGAHPPPAAPSRCNPLCRSAPCLWAARASGRLSGRSCARSASLARAPLERRGPFACTSSSCLSAAVLCRCLVSAWCTMRSAWLCSR